MNISSWYYRGICAYAVTKTFATANLMGDIPAMDGFSSAFEVHGRLGIGSSGGKLWMRLIERECFTRAGFWQAGFGYFYLEGDRRASEARRSKTEWDRGLALAAPRGSGELVLLARLVKQHAMPRKAGNEQIEFLFLLTHTVHASLPSACNASHSPRVGCSDWPSFQASSSSSLPRCDRGR